MALHEDLLAQAAWLTTKDARRPKQASLRRAVSTAYYALFHLLVDEASRFLVGGAKRIQLRHQLARAFEHGQMRHAASAFLNDPTSPWRRHLRARPAPAL